MRAVIATMLMMMMGAQPTVETEQGNATAALCSGSDEEEESSYAAVSRASPAKIQHKSRRKLPHRKRRLSSCKGSTQGSEKPAEEQRVRREKLELIDVNNLKYEGEEEERRGSEGTLHPRSSSR